MKPSTDSGSLKRGVLLLKLLTTAGARGRALTELSTQAGLPHSSTHRLLTQLIAERLAAHDAETRRYKLGPLAFELGVAGSAMYDIRNLCEPIMSEVAADTGDTVYLILRSGYDAVCMHRCEGFFPVRALVLEVGSRRPLGIGAGGLAILAAIEEPERSYILSKLSSELSTSWRVSPDDLVQACEQTVSDGMAVIESQVTLGIRAIGQPFYDSMGQAIGAISVAALSQRLDAQRTLKIADQLRSAARQVERTLRKNH